MYQALYRKWRPSTFQDVIGQDHITSILKYEVSNQKLNHAYLFCGSRGTGKTTCAKILAKAVNCAHPVDGSPCGKCQNCLSIESGATADVIEMDAASNNGVDNIRVIREEVSFVPSMLKYRVYIVDEVHMLSPSAFNALLKTLEEPPAHVIFILATTELQKIPATVVSRCQRFEFRRILTPDIAKRLKEVAAAEQIPLEDDAAFLIARKAQGGMRDALAMLDTCSGGGRVVSVESVNETIGSFGRETLLRVVDAVARHDTDAILDSVDSAVRSSRDLLVFWQDLIDIWREMLMVKTTPNAKSYLDLTDSEESEMRRVGESFSKEQLLTQSQMLTNALLDMQKVNAIKRFTAELTLLKMSDLRLDISPESLVARIAKLEDDVRSGQFATRTSDQKQGSHSEGGEKASQKAEPAPVKTVKEQKENVETVKKAVEKPAQAEDGLKLIRKWGDVTERLASLNPMSGSFLKTSKAFERPNGHVVITFAGRFGLDQVQRDRVMMNRIEQELSDTLGRTIGDDQLELSCDSGQTAGKPGLDEIDDSF